MKLRILIAILLAGSIVAAGVSARKKAAFSAAGDFPREALIYVQANDLPALIKLWNQSETKSKYLASQNFDEFSKSHLGLKLASRWQEFNDGTGSTIDLETISGLANDRAAAAIYDVGKLEFVFISPINEQLFAATMLMQNNDRFTEDELKDGTTIYRVAIDADGGNQKQELLFTHLQGRLIVATSERLLARTVANISGHSRKDRLSDDPGFRRLSDTIEPHNFTVWLNQAALNNDYYFKRYWLMGEASELKNLRSGICDFALEEGKIVEHRKFLLLRPSVTQSIKSGDAARAIRHIPANSSFYNLGSATPDAISDAVGDTISSRSGAPQKPGANRTYRYEQDDSGIGDNDYSYLNSKFDYEVNERSDEPKSSVAAKPVDGLAKILASASPENVLTFVRPEIMPAPFFVEFRRGAIFRLGTTAGFDRARFESTIRQKLLGQTMIATAATKINWETKTENGVTRRQFQLPMLGWNICYILRGNELLLANDSGFLDEMAAANNTYPSDHSPAKLDERTVLIVEQLESDYSGIFGKLADKTEPNDFFTGNIKSLIQSVPGIKKIEFEKSHTRDILEETISFHLK